jgi:hypothetical protein
MGMSYSRNREQRQHLLPLKSGEFAYLLAGQQVPSRLTWENSALDTPVD